MELSGESFDMLRLWLIALVLALTVNTASGSAGGVILVLGDSLSAAWGIGNGNGWVDLLAKRLEQRRLPYRVVNASISGDTTYGGLTRLPAALDRNRPAIVVIELGGNDGLRGLGLDKTRTNLARIIELVRTQGARPLLVGMHLPPNYGPAYTGKFHAIYHDLAASYQIPLVPFLLEGVATRPELMQGDGIHPRAEAQATMLDNVWPELEKMIATPASLRP
jgi:acyl-CoA thioesterase-1